MKIQQRYFKALAVKYSARSINVLSKLAIVIKKVKVMFDKLKEERRRAFMLVFLFVNITSFWIARMKRRYAGVTSVDGLYKKQQNMVRHSLMTHVTFRLSLVSA